MIQFSLPEKLLKYIYKGNKEKALYLLSRITALRKDHGLFDYDSYLRFVGYFRAKLLNDWGFYRESLAWVCLELELYKDNPSAIILKEELKKKLNIDDKFDKSKRKEFKTENWNGIAGMHALKSILEQEIILPRKYPNLYQAHNINIPNSYLFYGPPGCGKTFIVEALAKQINYRLIKLSPSDLGSTYVHGAQLRIKKVINEAIKIAPVLLFIDEFDAIAPNRDSASLSHHYAAEVNELLVQLDNISKTKLLFVAATNHIEKIDKAILRPGRIDKKIYIGPPDFEARIEAFKLRLKDKSLASLRYDYIAEMAEGLSFADIKLICDDAERNALQSSRSVDTDSLGSLVYNYNQKVKE